MDVENSQGGDHPTNDEEEYKRKKEDKMFAKLYDIFFPSDQQHHQQQQPPSSQELITTTTITTFADRGGPRNINFLGWAGADPTTPLGPPLVADQILPEEAPPLPEPAVVEVAAAADLAEQTRQQEEEASNLRRIKSLEAEQRLLLWECYCLHNLRKMQQANRHGRRNPQPASATPIRKKKTSDKRESVYMVPGSNIKAVDRWAWRKYGQKPIKGTYFPRSYYKCSTYRGCKAKKQVEQVLLDPEVYMVTYKGEHVHPNPVQLAHLPGPVHSSHPLCDLPNRFLLPPTQDQLPPPPPPPPPSETPFQQIPPSYEHPLAIPPPPQETVPVAAGEEEGLLIPNLMVDEDIMSYWKMCTDLGNGPSSSASGSGSSGPGFY